MPAPFSADLRRRVLDAARSDTAPAVAARFGVSVSTVHRLRRPNPSSLSDMIRHTALLFALILVQGCDSGDASNLPTVGDTIAPQIQLTSPAAGQELQGMAQVAYEATDNIGVTSVSVLLDGSVVATGSAGVASFDTRQFDDGAHALTLRAVDAAGNVGSLPSPIQVDIRNETSQDVTPPTVQLISPADGAVLSETVQVTYIATDNVSVSHVDILVNGSEVSQGFNGSGQFETEQFSNGSHSLSLRATDTSGNIGVLASPIMITIDNEIPVAATQFKITNVGLYDFDTTPGRYDVQSGLADVYVRLVSSDGSYFESGVVSNVGSGDLPIFFSTNSSLSPIMYVGEDNRVTFRDEDYDGTYDLIHTEIIRLSDHAIGRPSYVDIERNPEVFRIYINWID